MDGSMPDQDVCVTAFEDALGSKCFRVLNTVVYVRVTQSSDFD